MGPSRRTRPVAPGQDRRRAHGFFKDPYLLWFVAEDVPILGRLPENIGEVTRTILRSARGSPGLQEQLDSTRSAAWRKIKPRLRGTCQRREIPTY